MLADQKCHICNRRTAYERQELRGRVLCDVCADRVRDVSHAASSLSRYLMEWGKHEEWSEVPESVMLEAMDEAMKDFEERLTLGGPLAEGPRLLAVEVVDGELVLTVGTTAKQVWQESFGSWGSRNPRVIFQRIISSARRLGDLIDIYYWDCDEDRHAHRAVWTTDEHVQGELDKAVAQVPGGVPEFVFSVAGLAENKLEAISEHLFDLVRASGLYPGMMRIDKRNGVASCEASGDLTEHRREVIGFLIEHKGTVRADDLVISEGRLTRD